MPHYTNYYTHALQYLAQHATTLPDICTLHDVAHSCDLPYAWLVQQLMREALPGTCFGAPIHWRCRGTTIIEWLKEHAHEYPTPVAGTQRRHPPHHPPAHADFA